MIKVLIVDDEYLVRERLKQCLDWHALGYEVAGEAANGEDALMMLEHIPAQLAIVDINMPIIDGLEFAQAVQNNHPDVKIIILTGYSSFEYAKSALQAGVSDYLLKPINMDELTQVLTKLHHRIELDMQQKHLNVHLQQSLMESDNILKRKFMQSLLDGTASGSLQNKIELYCPSLQEGTLFVIAVSMNRTGAEDKDQPLWKRFAVSNIFNEILVKGQIKSFEMTYDEMNRVILLVAVQAVDRTDPNLSHVLKVCLDAIHAVSRHLKFTVTAGIGSVVESIHDAALSYREAVMACKYTTIYGGDRIIQFTALPEKTIAYELSHIREAMLILLRLGNASAVGQEIHKRIAVVSELEPSIDKLYSILYELVVTLRIFAADNKVDMSRLISEPFIPSQLVDELETMGEIERWVQDVYHNVMMQANSLIQSTPAKLVEKAKQYMDDNYGNEEMDLTEIAGIIFVNPTYLSRIFKNETGYSVVEYLTRRRMIKAKELIEQGCKNLYFIAESVGYKDAHYFSKCFKKYYSVTPSKFISVD
ncbi:DNA-binding response regulator [Paenibacillus baekrokdamisoli]|uniref:DNA-binding response regulator n=1 Tax=Paenibacillus baekrokdamisoli TaxID=1712516 RepID=A0A3G9J3U0_9BACL|nr:response regulator [Paenibacillus baekrokdamisoli]MBB3067938.1 two-component system response regulator YesN [Paenibacillus baekrokdamisoli]BBH23015.1 DNA-binding response regulator [Paenibacillus baekrokdamisoli]